MKNKGGRYYKNKGGKLRPGGAPCDMGQNTNRYGTKYESKRRQHQEPFLSSLARGVFAHGAFARGVFAYGVFARGVFAYGVFARGVFARGVAALSSGGAARRWARGGSPSCVSQADGSAERRHRSVVRALCRSLCGFRKSDIVQLHSR